MSRPVLALHGFMGSPEDFAFLRRKNVIAKAVCGDKTIVSTCHELMLEEECDIIGYSMGGRLALQMAFLFPERVKRVVLIGAHPGLFIEERLKRLLSDYQTAIQIEQEGMFLFIERWYSQKMFRRTSAQVKARAKKCCPYALAKTLRNLSLGAQDWLWPTPCDGVWSKVLYMAGCEDEKFCAIGKRTAAPFICVPEAGHAAHRDNGEFVNECINSFFNGDVGLAPGIHGRFI